MLLTRNPGLLALSVWLILVGLLPLLNLSFPASGVGPPRHLRQRFDGLSRGACLDIRLYPK